ncbi:glycosyltransferase family protein [Nitrospina gracilis]|uniref:glycosyltransferase family protein n=1 Tax=Nitrospina gracilis TaxID=35801 RepID=UPI001F1963E1|nr:glycosyltransferase [Nitrospina gracilis]MCF8720702.1 spore maturation protein CgeB/cyclopropane fatty-acyl-phospholipid synthase-like methyltransferase [Nitrospina gracilis Nb-211]
MDLKILTFNWHEPYICLMAHTGYEFHILEPETGPGQRRQWDRNMRPLPQNGRIVGETEAWRNLEEGNYALVVAHNLKDLAWARDYDIPKIAVFHNKFSTEAGLSGNSVDKEKYFRLVEDLTRGVHRVFISQSKRDDWGLEGDIIRPGLPLDEYGGYDGTGGFILRVGNHLKERDLMLGYTASSQIVEGFECVTLGQNPQIPGSRLSNGFDDLKEHYRRGRVFVNTTVDGYEDGYNLSMLEAMATGMPVVSTCNATSPIENGVNGYISDDIATLRQGVEELLRNPDKAREMGKNARETVARLFPIGRFVKNWKQAVQTAIDLFLVRHEAVEEGGAEGFAALPEKLNILMDTNGNPVTTAHYLERALRRQCHVITCGSAFTREQRQNWNMEALDWPVNQPEIRREPGETIQSVLGKLPADWRPNVYLYVETGLNAIPADLHTLQVPKVCYLIDTHLNKEQHLKIARHFDMVFLAQREYVDEFRRVGIQHVEWLPLACDPEIHGKQNLEKKYDVGFVGSILPNLPRRGELLDRLATHFNTHIERQFMKKMAGVFSQSRIVFNNAVRNDLNMRVFEALCSGSLLATDEAPGSGLTDLFENGKHLVVYEDDSIVDTVRHYLDHPDEAERIAEAGRREVLARHTYDHRAETLVDRVKEWVKTRLTEEGEPVSGDNGVSDYYRNVRQDLLHLVPRDAQSVLEVGCGAGHTGHAIRERQGAVVTGIEVNSRAAAEARRHLDIVLEGSVENMDLPFAEKEFDCILFADVLEHLVDPALVLRKTLPYLSERGVVVASIPNIQYHGILNQLGEGNWTYEDEGILDRTHLRFFTLKEIQKLFAETGYEVRVVEENLDPQYEKFVSPGQTSIRTGRVTISDLTPEELKRFFVIQYKLVAQPAIHAEGSFRSDSLVQMDNKIESHEFHNKEVFS